MEAFKKLLTWRGIIHFYWNLRKIFVLNWVQSLNGFWQIIEFKTLLKLHFGTPVNLLHIFRTTFSKKTSGWLLLFLPKRVRKNLFQRFVSKISFHELFYRWHRQVIINLDKNSGKDRKIIVGMLKSNGPSTSTKRCTPRSETIFGCWKSFKNDEKYFLFHVKSSLRSQDV